MSDEKTPICYGQVNEGTWCQESYCAKSRHAGIRSKQLRKLGYKVRTGALGNQVTGVGIVKLTMVHIEPGQNEDTFGLPEVKIERL